MTNFYFNDVQLLDIELSNRCNAACPMCARNIHGWSINPRLKLDELTLDDIKNIDKKYLKQLDTINISGDYGDPLTNSNVVNIIEYFLKHTTARMIIHTNGGVRSSTVWEQLGKLSAAREHFEIRFAIDGLADTNHIYRIGVHWQMLMENVKTFISNGGNATWIFLVFFHNQHQIDEASRLAKDLGFNSFRTVVSDRFRADNFPVYNKAGELAYNIFPSVVDINEYSQFNHRKESSLNVKKKQNNKGYEYLRRIAKPFVNLTSKALVNMLNKEDKHSPQPSLNCYALADKRLYIDANGYVFPCNNLGYIHSWANKADHFTEQIVNELNKHTQTNIKTDKLSNIINGSWFKYIYETWQATTINDGRFIMCSYTCGKRGVHKMIKEHKL
jgi:MoaA/NifB/PqqE/SkfB family radical SAM enzyme